MRTKLIITALALGGMALLLSSCASTIADVGASTVAFVRGDLQVLLGKDMAEVYDASLKALDDLEMEVTDKQQNALESRIAAITTQGKKVRIMLRRTENFLTKVNISTKGFIGDEALARAIYDQIKTNLVASQCAPEQ